MPMKKIKELPAGMLRGVVDPDSLGVESTKDVSSMEGPVIAQERALEALDFALGMQGLEYNVYVAGPSKADMETLTNILVNKAAAQSTAPPDWIYLNNFKDSENPRIVAMETSQGKVFKKDMEELIETVQAEIPEVFESDDYNSRKEAVSKEFDATRRGVLSKLQNEVEEQGFVLNMGQTGMMIIPAKDGMPLGEEDIKALDAKTRKELRAKSEALQVRMNEVARTLRKLEKDLKKRQKKLDQEVALYAVGHHVEDLQEKYAQYDIVKEYLEEVKDDIVNSLDDFRQKSGGCSSHFPSVPRSPICRAMKSMCSWIIPT